VKLPVRNAEGKELRKLDVDDSVFGIEPNASVLHQAFVAGRNNQRWGTAQTKTRGRVQGSTAKIRRQKYTGRARAGSNRAPNRVGGGVAFGPQQRDYSQALNKKMRRLAIRSALSGKVADDQLVIIDQLVFPRPKTKAIVDVLRNVGIERSALIVTGAPERSVFVSARNLARTKVLPAAYLNVVDMMNHQKLLLTVDAVRIAEELWGKAKTAPTAVAEAKPKRVSAAKASAAEEKPKRVSAAKASVAEEKPKRARAAEAAVMEDAAEPQDSIAKASVAVAPATKPKRAKTRTGAKAPAKATAKKTAAPKEPAAKAKDSEPAAEAPKPRARRAKKTAESGE